MPHQSFRAATERFEEDGRSAVERALLEVCPDLVVLAPIRNGTGAVIDFEMAYLSETAADLLGLEPGEAESNALSSLFPGYGQTLLADLTEVLETGISHTNASLIRQHAEAEPQGTQSVLVHSSKMGDGILIALEGYSEGSASAESKRARAAMLEELLTRAPQLVVFAESDGEFAFVNEAFAGLLETTPTELIGSDFIRSLPADFGPLWSEPALGVAGSGEASSSVLSLPSSEGFRTYAVANFPVSDLLGHPVGIGTIATDVTELRGLQSEVLEKAALLDLSNDAIVAHDLDGVVKYWNGGAERLYGWSEDEAVGSQITDLFQPEGVAAGGRPSWRSHAGGSWVGDLTQVRKDGSHVVVRSHQSLKRPDATSPGLVLEINIDISKEKALELRVGRLAAIVESTDDALMSLAPDGTITTWNAGAEGLYGWPPEVAVGKSEDDLMTPDEDVGSRARVRERVVSDGAVEIFEGEDNRSDHTRVEVLVSYSPIRDSEGAIVGIARGARDVTEVKQAEREARFLAEHDPLTGLPNRRRLNTELEKCLGEAATNKVPSALLLGDLDEFKIVNDALGHDVGDEFLRGIASVLKATLRETDLLIRLGGDEFAILLRHTSLGDAKHVAGGLCEAVDAYSSINKGRSVHATISIGVAGIDGTLIKRPDQALSAADAAMYDAKREGRNRYAVAGRGSGRGYLRNVLQWSQRINEALEDDRLVLYSQPILDLSDQGRKRSELLLRIREESRVLTPGSFIPVAERYGMISRIDHWVVDHAVQLLAEGHEDLGVLGINLSGASFSTPSLTEYLKRRLNESGVDPHRLSIEITETSAITSLTNAAALLQGIQDLGCEIGIDDFGSGTGSFTYLSNLPINYLKLDRHLIRDILEDRKAQVVAQGVVDVAHGLGHFTVAEFVDSADKLQQCRNMGIDFAQGFAIAKPSPIRPVVTAHSSADS